VPHGPLPVTMSVQPAPGPNAAGQAPVARSVVPQQQ
jgi:hypothetical protein